MYRWLSEKESDVRIFLSFYVFVAGCTRKDNRSIFSCISKIYYFVVDYLVRLFHFTPYPALVLGRGTLIQHPLKGSRKNSLIQFPVSTKFCSIRFCEERGDQTQFSLLKRKVYDGSPFFKFCFLRIAFIFISVLIFIHSLSFIYHFTGLFGNNIMTNSELAC